MAEVVVFPAGRAMESSISNKHVRWISDLLVVAVCIIGYVFLFCWAVGSIYQSEHRIYARVLEKDETHDENFLVDFIYGGKKYQKSIDGRGDLKSGQTVKLHFFGGNPMEADWYSHPRRWRGPTNTPTGSLLAPVALFGAFIPPGLLWNKFFRGRRPLPFITASNATAHYGPTVTRPVIRWHGWLMQKVGPFGAGIVYPLMVVAVILTFNIMLGPSPSERDLRDLLAEAYLSAMADGRINDAAELIYWEDRYDFLSNVVRWKLNDYRIIGKGEEPHSWNVKFWHHSILDGKVIEDTSVLETIYNGRFRVKSGYLPLDSSAQSDIDLSVDTDN